MKKFLTISIYSALSFLLVNKVHSQKINWGTEYERKENNRVVSLKEYMERRIVGWDNSGFYMYVIENQSNAFVSLFPILEKYDYNLNQVYSEKIGLPKKDGTIEPRNIVNKEEAVEINIVNQTPVVAFPLENLTTNEISISSLLLNKKGQVQSTINTMIKIPGGRKTFGYNWNVKLSADSSKLGIFASSYATKEDAPFVQYKIVDDQLNVLTEQSFPLKYTEDGFYLEDFCIDNKNNIHILASLPQGKIRQYKLFSYYVEDKKLVESNINDNNSIICSAALFTPQKGFPMVAGFSSDSDEKEAKSFFVKKAGSSSSETSAVIYKKFDNALLSEVLNEKKLIKKPFIENLFIRNLLETKDGSYIFMAEQLALNVSDYSTNFSPDKTIVGSIIAIKTDASCAIKWWHGIYKSQERTVKFTSSLRGRAESMASYSSTTGKDHIPFYSYTYSLNKDNLLILYNDNVKNKTTLAVEDLKTLDEKDDYNPVLITLSPTGTVKKSLYAIEEKYSFRPKLSFYSGQAGLITYKREHKLYRFGKVTF